MKHEDRPGFVFDTEIQATAKAAELNRESAEKARLLNSPPPKRPKYRVYVFLASVLRPCYVVCQSSYGELGAAGLAVLSLPGVECKELNKWKKQLSAEQETLRRKYTRRRRQPPEDPV